MFLNFLLLFSKVFILIWETLKFFFVFSKNLSRLWNFFTQKLWRIKTVHRGYHFPTVPLPCYSLRVSLTRRRRSCLPRRNRGEFPRNESSEIKMEITETSGYIIDTKGYERIDATRNRAQNLWQPSYLSLFLLTLWKKNLTKKTLYENQQHHQTQRTYHKSKTASLSIFKL